jgi:putative sterol carrier protein
MATTEDIKNSLEGVRGKLDDPILKQRFAAFSKNLQFTCTDLGTSFVMRIENGEMKSLAEGNTENPDIHVTVESEVLMNILNKKINPMMAYTTGKLKVKGTLTDLLKLQKLL